MMIKYGNIALTTTITLLTLYHTCILFLVRLGGYIVNLSDFYSYRLNRETDRFFTASRVQLVETDRGQFQFHRETFVQQLKNRVVLRVLFLSEVY